MMKILWMYGRMIDLVCPYVHKILITDDLVRVCPYYVHKTVIVQVSLTSTYIWNYSVGKKE